MFVESPVRLFGLALLVKRVIKSPSAVRRWGWLVQLAKAIALLDGPKHLSTVSFQLHHLKAVKGFEPMTFPERFSSWGCSPAELHSLQVVQLSACAGWRLKENPVESIEVLRRVWRWL